MLNRVIEKNQKNPRMLFSANPDMNSEFSQQLIGIRPHIPDVTDKNYGPSETVQAFQNHVIRPILKLNHGKIILIDQHQIRPKLKSKISLDQHQNIYATILSKDISLRYTLLGLVQGFLTEEEFLIYMAYKSEIDRRIINMIIQRIRSHHEPAPIPEY